MMFVSLQTASDHLRRGTTADDALVELYIQAASQAVANYIGDNANFFNSAGVPSADSNGIALDIPEDVKIATLLLIGYYYKDRDNDEGHEYETGYLPRPVTAMLYPYRNFGIG
jgi:hypothetical protein